MSGPSEALHREIEFGQALIPVFALIAFLSGVILGVPALEPDFEGSGHLPLLMAAAVGVVVAMRHGWRWVELQEGMLDAIRMSMGAVLILMTIGMLMGTWLASGIVPALIHWGLTLLDPQFFLPATCAVCSIVSLVSGSSWSTAGTVGLALIGVGNAMGIDPAMTAGAVVSGAYFGDKLSPMSDTTNLAPAMAGAELFDHIRHMIYTTGPSWVIAMVFYVVLSLGLEPTPAGGSVESISAFIVDTFRPGLIHLVPPVVVVGLVLRRIPALPALFAGVLMGALVALVQGETLGSVIAASMGGYVSASGDAAVDELLSRGGMMSMGNTVFLVLCAMCFGGVMERTGMLRVIAGRVLARAKTTGSLIATTVMTSFGMNVVAADQYISIVVPGRMYERAYRERGLHPKNLSRALEDGGTITSPLIPWNTCGAFMAATLMVPTAAYLPYALLNILNPIISMVYGFTGWTIVMVEPTSASEPAGADPGEPGRL